MSDGTRPLPLHNTMNPEAVTALLGAAEGQGTHGPPGAAHSLAQVRPFREAVAPPPGTVGRTAIRSFGFLDHGGSDMPVSEQPKTIRI